VGHVAFDSFETYADAVAAAIHGGNALAAYLGGASVIGCECDPRPPDGQRRASRCSSRCSEARAAHAHGGHHDHDREETRADPGPSGPDAFGFELRLPGRADELTMRSMAYLAYRTLRKSGLRWAVWTGDGRRVTRAAPAPVAASEEVLAGRGARRREVDWGVAFMGLVLLGVLALFVPRELALPLGAAFGTLALVAAIDTARRRWTRRARGTRLARSRDRASPAGRRALSRSMPSSLRTSVLSVDVNGRTVDAGTD
jgi:hypothetical protein